MNFVGFLCIIMSLAVHLKSVQSKLNLKPGFKLRKEQLQTITNVIEKKKDLIVSWPTGYGKSMCYLFPQLILDEVSLL